MESSQQKPKLVAIVGPTASGKSELAMKLALAFNGEIIAADSRTLYRGMDIGTAKPTADDRKKVAHHMLDLLEPSQRFSVGQFKKEAERLIEDIKSRGKLPILVGGTGLYVDAVLFDYKFDGPNKRDPVNPRHKLASLPTPKKLIKEALIIGIMPERDELQKRLKLRLEQMLDAGLMEEIKTLAAKYPSDLEAFKAPGYQAFFAYQEGEIDLAEAKKLLVQTSLQLAKKQRTWFSKNKEIKWFSHPEPALSYLVKVLNKQNNP